MPKKTQKPTVDNRGRIQIQGKKPYVEKSFSWSGQDVITASVGLAELDKLWNSLSKTEQADRLDAYRCAKQFINNAQKNGGITAPPTATMSCKDSKRKDPSARIDIEVHSGKAFF